jgi:predicted Zn-dependent peptidase
VNPSTTKFPRAEYSVRIEWTCDPERTATLVQRVFEEVDAVKAAYLSRDQVSRIRAALLREFEVNSQDNGYHLNEISRHYRDGDGADVAPVGSIPDRIAALTGAAIQQAAQTYLNTGSYVKVTLMPAK